MNIIKIDDVIEFLKGQESGIQIGFPFDGSLNGNPNEILTKILFINYRESTRIKNVDVTKLANHIESVLKADDYDIICRGELGDEYYDIVDRIAFGHGIHGIRKGKATKEYNLTSFSSKFCGSHNLSAPFWDNIVSEWLMNNDYQHNYRDYPQYVKAIIRLQSDHNLHNYSLREIEYAIWSKCKE